MPTVPLRYVGPSRRPIEIAETGQLVIREDAPLPAYDPAAGELEAPAVVVDVPEELAARLLAQPIWARADDYARDLEQADLDPPDLAGAAGDDPTDGGPPADHQEE